MSNKRNFFRDTFAFSLRGMTATASFFITPVIGDDRINRAWDEKLGGDGRERGASRAAPHSPVAEPLTRSTG
ncbi:MAG: hypothetical protein QNJ23_12335 [Woeseiaceae bacterium]|nr:hypothetical protein [Woeseiaceae bacterium]